MSWLSGARGIAREPENPEDSQRWQRLARRLLLDGRPWLQVWQEDFRLPGGRVVEGFYTLEIPDYVVIVALTPERQAVTLCQYKPGPDRVALNLPAGFLEPNEAPPAAARRELLEETGYAASEWRPLGSYVTDGNRGAGTGHFFLALDARQVRPPDSGDLEAMTVELRSLPQLRQALLAGDVPVLPIAAAISLALLAYPSEL